MKILISASTGVGMKSGWGYYIEKGTKRKPRDPNKIELLRGDTVLGDEISNSGVWKENEYKIILAFKGKVDKETMKEVLSDFLDSFMKGFSKEEYHVDAVAHYDTDDYHIHVRIPKRNLLTGTALRLYMHSQDVTRINLIRDVINQKYQLYITVDEQPLVTENKEIERIQFWRKQSGMEPFSFKTKKMRMQAEQDISTTVLSYIENGLLDSFYELREFIEEELELKIVKKGYDKPKDFYYLTVENDKNEKLRIKGDFYGEQFWGNKREIRIEQAKDNKRDRKEQSGDRRSLATLEQELEKANRKRETEVNRDYKRARERAKKRWKQILLDAHPQCFTAFSHFSTPFFPVGVCRANEISDYIFSGERVLENRAQSNLEQRELLHHKKEVNHERTREETRSIAIATQEATADARRRAQSISGAVRERSSNICNALEETEQRAVEGIGARRIGVEASVASHARKVDAAIERSDTELREIMGKIRKLFASVGERIEDIKESIEGIANEIRKMKLFEQAKNKLRPHRRRPFKKLSPRR